MPDIPVLHATSRPSSSCGKGKKGVGSVGKIADNLSIIGLLFTATSTAFKEKLFAVILLRFLSFSVSSRLRPASTAGYDTLSYSSRRA